jgi:hypothetical protein
MIIIIVAAVETSNLAGFVLFGSSEQTLYGVHYFVVILFGLAVLRSIGTAM